MMYLEVGGANEVGKGIEGCRSIGAKLSVLLRTAATNAQISERSTLAK